MKIAHLEIINLDKITDAITCQVETASKRP